MNIANKPRQVFRPHPVLGWSLTPGARIEVSFRTDVTQHINSAGWRKVPGAPVTFDKNLVIYGCSFTYGTCLADAETFPALVQATRSDIRVVNRGIGGHGSVQNYLQFRRDLQVGQVQAAVFGVISDHRYRNIPHPQRMQQLQKQEWYELGVEHVPVARQNRGGDLVIDYVPIWQPRLERRDFDDFLPNEYMIDQATVCVLQAIATTARQKGIPVIFALLDQLDQGFNETVLRQVPQAVDISVPLDEKHTFMPRDIHPNDYANQIIADRLVTLMHERFSGELGGT